MNTEKLKQLFQGLNRELPPIQASAALLGALAIFAFLHFQYTFMRWPDPIVDFGREIYVPWQLAEGSALHRDIPYFQGPLSPWLNALWFKLFGVGLLTLAWANLAVFLGIIGVLFVILEKIADRFAAFFGCLLAITVFGFGQYMNTANYNFITPYAHEVSHGMLLSVIALLLANRMWENQGRHSGFFLGCILGALFLTKPEMFAAGFSGVVALFGYGYFSEWSEERKSRLPGLLLRLLIGIALVIGAAFAALWNSNDAAGAVKAVLGGFYQLINSNVTSNPFQAWVSGFNDIPGNLIIIAAVTFVWFAVFFVGKYLDRWQAMLSSKPAPRISIFFAVFLFLVLIFPFVPFPFLPRALPVFSALFIFQFWPGVRSELLQAIPAKHRPLAFGFAVFSFIILLRMILKVHFVHYGFAFALPASLLMVALVICWAPKVFHSRHQGGQLVKAFGVYLVLAFSIFHFQADLPAAQNRIFPMSPRAEDAFLVDRPTAQVFGALNHAISAHIRPGETLVVIPEGVMINYLHRHQSPGGYTSYLPVVFDIFGEQTILSRFSADPPDFVLFYYMSGAEWGKPDFGRDYGVVLGNYIRENYKSVWLIGAPPFDGSGRFGVELLQRKLK